MTPGEGKQSRVAIFGCVLGFLMWADVITTEAAMRLGLLEHNPLMEQVVASPLLHLAVKTAVLAVIVIVARCCERLVPSSGAYLIVALAGFYLAVIVNNLFFLI
ncbi:MAG: DUF5658 family protein [Methanomicrobiales archaeon]|nr:DUF5658 family protein [Methanomicrobiales archaeon]MDI6876931.1 DUF5658 family protein [Methanomicrobiales archaeon]